MANHANIIIKQNTQQLLIWLYSANGQERLVPYEQVKYLWPQLSDSGRRSTIYYLSKQRFINIHTQNRKKFLELSSFGMDWIEKNCFAISSTSRNWDGQWALVAIYSNNVTDPNFRALRALLGQYGAIAVERGLYLIPSFISVVLTEKLSKNYRNSVLVWGVQKWLFGDEKMFTFGKTGLLDLVELYSSFSKDLDELISFKKFKKTTIVSRTELVFNLYARFNGLIKDDSGLTYYFFKNAPNAHFLLSRLQELSADL
ncbi:MAG: hypothetical protein LBG64_01855 [Pseudomonadales bacterium]|jgi:DNA-binding transcriptional regulator PaaX|nr:hypothetical protein [Pseudomonadales bacterium]